MSGDYYVTDDAGVIEVNYVGPYVILGAFAASIGGWFRIEVSSLEDEGVKGYVDVLIVDPDVYYHGVEGTVNVLGETYPERAFVYAPSYLRDAFNAFDEILLK